jgi:GABA permease
LLSRAAGSEVVAVVGAHEPFAAVRDAMEMMGFDEVIVSMLPARTSRWLHVELPGRIRTLGVPVTEVIGAELPAPLPAA